MMTTSQLRLGRDALKRNGGGCLVEPHGRISDGARHPLFLLEE